jgi:hypothetical protein
MIGDNLEAENEINYLLYVIYFKLFDKKNAAS